MSNGSIATVVVADTGPLLSAGGMTNYTGVNLLYQRYEKQGTRLLRPLVVQRELLGLAKHADLVGRAAMKMTNRKTQFIAVDDTKWTAAERQSVRDQLDDVERAIARRQRRAPKLSGNDGEIDAILLAEREGAVLLTNENAALNLARKRGITVGTFAHVLSAEVHDGRMTADDVGLILETMTAGGSRIHIGGRQESPLDVTDLTPVPGL